LSDQAPIVLRENRKRRKEADMRMSATTRLAVPAIFAAAALERLDERRVDLRRVDVVLASP
jgi:hypothetical protein